MESQKSLEIIQNMMNESKRSLVKNSFFFIMWAAILVPSGIIEYTLAGTKMAYFVWPVMALIGGIISTIYSKKESKRVGVSTFSDRISGYTWGGFGFALFFSIAFSIKIQFPPHALILMVAGLAVFINGGISNFKPFIFGAIALEIGAMVCGFLVDPIYHSLVFSASIFVGYLVPGISLRKLENEQAQ